MTIGLFFHIFEIMSLTLLCATIAQMVAQKCTPFSTMYPRLRGEALATNRPYFMASMTRSLVKLKPINTEGMK